MADDVHLRGAIRAGAQAAGLAPRHVEYELELDGAEHRWTVAEITINEALGSTYEAVLRVHADARDVELATELLGRDASVILDRRDGHSRRLSGIIDRVEAIGSRQHRTEVEVRVVPAFELLGHGSDSRIFQEKTAVEIVEEVLGLAFGPYRRELDASGLVGEYATREMCVQYRESHKAFVSRLLEEEGIGYYFDFDGGGHERMVLFDAQSQLATLTTMDGDAVPYADGAQVVRGAEPIVSFEPQHRLGATSITVRDLDWTEEQYRAEASREGEDLRGYVRAVYDHGHGKSVTLHDFTPGGRYGGSDVERQAQIRHELLVRDQDRFEGVSMLVGLRPGVIVEMTGHPVAGIDGRYLVLKARHASAPPPHGSDRAGEGASDGEDYHNVFECIRAMETAWEPSRTTPKPAIYGVQTAVVTGPAQGEPYTDEYGRIRVQFHWDREAIDPSRTSAWLRLGQTWAGADSSGLHTFLFIPRVGSEVIVTFLDGDPDRPLVTGAVYNAKNLPPLALPGEATRSVIRTATIGGGDGHNELSFEDQRGREEVYLRAQRNLKELVLHDHKTHVKNDHTNVVDGKDDETIGGDQWLRVKGAERRKWIENSEFNEIQADRETDVFGNDTLRVHSDAITNVTNNMTFDVGGTYDAHVVGAQSYTIDGGSTLTVTGGITQSIPSGGWSMTTTGNVTHHVTGGVVMDVSDGVSWTAGADVAIDAAGAMNLSGKSIELRAAKEVIINAPAGHRNATPATETHVSQSFVQQAASFMEDAKIKIAAYTLALSIYGTKIDYSGLKVDLYKLKIDNKDVHAVLDNVAIGNTSSARIARAALTMIG